MLATLVAGVISPLLAVSLRHLALGLAGFALLGSACWLIYTRRQHWPITIVDHESV
jgi:hypothetical protein